MADIRTVEVAARDLPLHCPPGAAAAIWNPHPRAFLDVLHTGEAVCRMHDVLKGEAPNRH